MSDPSSLPSGALWRRLLPTATWLRLLAGWSVVGLFTVWGATWMSPPIQASTATLVFVLLFATILAASFGVVREADHLAHALGEPYGTLILTLSIVTIEVILIASVLLGPGDFPTIGRDSIFAVMMIILNLVVGLCLIGGATRHGGQTYNAQGATAYLSMIALLTGTALVLPRFTSGAGEFTPLQAGVMAAVTAVLYAAFVWMQMRSHRHFFVQPLPGRLDVPANLPADRLRLESGATASSRAELLGRTALLLAMILPIVLLAHHLAVITDHGIAAIGAPAAVGGVLIAIIVFTPESITAVRAALGDEMQRTINLCLGAFVSTVGLTVPAVLVIGQVTGKQVLMGISDTEIVLFALTLVLSMLSFNGRRTSAIQGWMHLALFLIFSLLLFQP